MSSAAVRGAEGAANLTRLYGWLGGENNRSEPCVTERLDAAGCLFISLLSSGDAVLALILLLCALTAFSLAINGLTLYGLERSEDHSWERRAALLKNLVLTDLIQTITFAPSVIHALVRRRTMAFNAWCYVQYFVGTVGVFSSLGTITFMALERYVFVCHAIHYLVLLTPVRLRAAVSLVWVYSLSVGSINLMLLATGEEQEDEEATRGLLCEPDMMEQHMGFPRAAALFRKVLGPLTLMTCLLVYAVSYLRMYQDATNATIPFNAVNTAARKTVLFYLGMLFVQLLPLLVKVLSDAVWEVEDYYSRSDGRKGRPPHSPAAAALHVCLVISLMVPPCVNPLVYGMRNKETRRALLGPLRWWTEWMRGERE